MPNQTITVANSDSIQEVEVGSSPELHKQPLPKEEFDGESETATNVRIAICSSHTKDNWTKHEGYIDNKDGTIGCKWCPWGTFLSGRYRVHEEKIVDLKYL